MNINQSTVATLPLFSYLYSLMPQRNWETSPNICYLMSVDETWFQENGRGDGQAARQHVNNNRVQRKDNWDVARETTTDYKIVRCPRSLEKGIIC